MIHIFKGNGHRFGHVDQMRYLDELKRSDNNDDSYYGDQRVGVHEDMVRITPSILFENKETASGRNATAKPENDRGTAATSMSTSNSNSTTAADPMDMDDAAGRPPEYCYMTEHQWRQTLR